jgi:hypothetical protein
MRYVVLYGSLCRLRLRGMTCPITWTGALSQRLQGALRAPGKSRAQRGTLTMSNALHRASGLVRVRATGGEESADTSKK